MATANPKKTLSASAFVLMVGDEGAILVQIYKKKVVRRMFAQSPEPAHTVALNEALNSSPKAPITLLVDIMDQSYIRQTLPPVSRLSVGKIVKRRLDKDFGPEDITGYLILDREKSGRKDWNYIMASLANPALLQKWISFAVERSNPFRGMALVPLEAQPFMLAAEKAVLLQEKGKNAAMPEWQIMVNHHKVGGFRQIVLHKGKLIFTRMAQPIGESVPEVVAGNIEQEMTNTMEYLKRLGLQGPDSVSVMIVASTEIKKVLDSKNIKAGSYHFFTPYELAQLLNISDAAQPEDQFGDVIISAFVGKKNKLLLTLGTPYIRRIYSFTRYILATRLTAATLSLGLVAWAGMSGYDIYSLKDDIDKLVSTQSSLQAKLAATKKKSLTLPKDINYYTDIQILAHSFNKRHYDPLVFANTFIDSLHGDALISTYSWALSNALELTKDSDKRQLKTEISLHLNTPLEPHDIFIANADEFIKRLTTGFPDYDVTHSELPGVLSENQDLKTVIDDSTNTAAPAVTSQADNTIKITISGPIQKATGNKH